MDRQSPNKQAEDLQPTERQKDSEGEPSLSDKTEIQRNQLQLISSLEFMMIIPEGPFQFVLLDPFVAGLI